jgi:zinc transport system ATP-binding protein
VSAAVELAGVAFRYGDVTVLDGVDLRVERGDFLGVIGPNGAGKTTLLRVILGLVPPAGGTARLFGGPPATERVRRRVGYVPQQAAIDTTLPATVSEVVETGLGAALGWFAPDRAEGRRRVRTALEQVGLAARAATRIRTLSSGQRQRVLIARALVSDPELLLLDEPAAGIDADAQATLAGLLRRLHRERGVTVIMVSHDLAAVAREVATLACLNRRLVFHGPPGEFRADVAAAALLGPWASFVGTPLGR